MSFAPNSLADAVRFGLQEVGAVKTVADGIRVTTQCMYPSNSLVDVVVRGRGNTIVASDEAAAVGEAIAAGIPVKESDRALIGLIKDQGLRVQRGTIYTPEMPLAAAPLAVLLVANASKEVAHWFFDHAKIKRTRDFKALLANFLRVTFDNRVHPASIDGKHKAHKFSNVIDFPSGKRLLIDPVTNEPSSISSRIVANLDVKAAANPLIDQRIVYDDEEGWSPGDLNLLQVSGAIVVPFSRSEEVIRRIAVNA
jgi:hypothetical protein